LHNQNNSTLIKANFTKTANFLKDLTYEVFLIVEYERLKKNATRSTVLAFVEDPVGYKIELIEKETYEGIRRKYY